MAFGFAPPLQPRPMMMPAPMSFPTMNLTQSGPAGYVPQMGQGGGKSITFGDVKSGLQKLMGGPQPGQGAAGDQGLYAGPSVNAAGYTPPSSAGDFNMGPMMGGAMDGAAAGGGAAAGSGAAAGAGADAAGAAGSAAAGDAAAGAGGADIGSFIAALFGL